MRALNRCNYFTGLLCCALVLGCGDDGTVGGGQMVTTHSSVSDGYDLSGAVEVVAHAGLGVKGLSSGTGTGQILDGWTVSHSKVLVTFGSFTFPQTDGSEVVAPVNVVVDLLGLTDAGDVLTMVDLPRGARSLDFTMPAATESFTALSAATAAADVDLMIKGGYSLYVEGTLEKEDGFSCTNGTDDCVMAPVITFRWGLQAGTSFAGCTGKASLTEATSQVELMLPAIHWLQTSFRADVETAPLRAQWIADADLDHDGEVTVDELAASTASTLFPAEFYDFSRAPIPIDSGLDFVVEQARAIGRDSWGGCSSTGSL